MKTSVQVLLLQNPHYLIHITMRINNDDPANLLGLTVLIHSGIYSDFNGCQGTVSEYAASNDHYTVRIIDGGSNGDDDQSTNRTNALETLLLIKASNLKIMKHQEDDDKTCQSIELPSSRRDKFDDDQQSLSQIPMVEPALLSNLEITEQYGSKRDDEKINKSIELPSLCNKFNDDQQS